MLHYNVLQLPYFTDMHALVNVILLSHLGGDFI